MHTLQRFHNNCARPRNVDDALTQLANKLLSQYIIAVPFLFLICAVLHKSFSLRPFLVIVCLRFARTRESTAVVIELLQALFFSSRVSGFLVQIFIAR